ncbi:MAG: hypothetical protein FWH55_05045 [Oscillospiraceae bacterium]|nr:hypothetical protein [Oscillospiraceae bacterium]
MIKASDIIAFLEKENIRHKRFGDDRFEITGFSPVHEAKNNTVTWIRKTADFDFSRVENHLGMLIVADEMPSHVQRRDGGFIINGEYAFDGCLIIVDYPRAVYFEILNSFFTQREQPSISASAIVETDKIGKNVSIGRFTYICGDAVIGDNVTIKNNVSIECPVVVGDDSVIESGAVIGCGGYGYYTISDDTPKKIPDFGGVIIGRNVAVGANTCIVRGTLGNTIIGDDVKIDNLCHIAHNVQIGKRCYVVALSMLAGSCIIGDDTYIAPGVMVMNQAKIGQRSFLGMGAVVLKDVDENKVVIGVPGKVVRDNKGNAID